MREAVGRDLIESIMKRRGGQESSRRGNIADAANRQVAITQGSADAGLEWPGPKASPARHRPEISTADLKMCVIRWRRRRLSNAEADEA